MPAGTRTAQVGNQWKSEAVGTNSVQAREHITILDTRPSSGCSSVLRSSHREDRIAGEAERQAIAFVKQVLPVLDSYIPILRLPRCAQTTPNKIREKRHRFPACIGQFCTQLTDNHTDNLLVDWAGELVQMADYLRFHSNQDRKPTNRKNSTGSPINISGLNATEDIDRRLGLGHVFGIECHLSRDLVAYAPILAAPCHPREEYAHPMSTSHRRAALPVLAPGATRF